MYGPIIQCGMALFGIYWIKYCRLEILSLLFCLVIKMNLTLAIWNNNDPKSFHFHENYELHLSFFDTFMMNSLKPQFRIYCLQKKLSVFNKKLYLAAATFSLGSFLLRWGISQIQNIWTFCEAFKETTLWIFL